MITIEKKPVRAGKIVGNDHVDMVVRNYKQNRWIQNSERIGKEDSLSVWFSADELEEYIQWIKENGADGVKCYFGAYPENFEEKPEYSGRQTIVMVATKSKQTDKGLVNKDLYIQKNGELTVMGINMGALCPPYCGGFSFNTKDVGDRGITIIDCGDKGISVI